MKNSHEKYMKIALGLAEKGRASVSPNPLVGCVIVKNNRIIGSGWHEKAGNPHAECIALKEATESTAGAIAYVTLEPCCHFGRTPPCAPLFIQAGIKAVYIATLDPNPLVNSQGVEILKNAGIEVYVGMCEEEALLQNRIFFHFIKYKYPFVIAKWAMSLDGKTSVNGSDNRQLSSLQSQRECHRLRHEVDAILIGSHTAILDNPLLTVRHQEVIYKHPIRIVICGSTLLPLELHLFDISLPSETWVIVPHDIDATWLKRAEKKQLNVILMEHTNNRISLPALMDYLRAQQITSLLVEGGMSVLNSFFTEQLVNESCVFLTPFIIAQSPKKSNVSFNEIRKMGSDFYITASHEVKNV